jgi:predicted RNase H-like HicB family nuclease
MHKNIVNSRYNQNCQNYNFILNQNMTREFNVIIERDSDGYFVATVPNLMGCHTQAKSLDKLMERIQEAIELCLEVEQDASEELEFVGVQRISLEV